ncbi:MAG: hypothetical protein PHP21_03435, partial [Patescibacteria group bacterium]|nr:hypothetical protein [Patescibacteria group bacterium]
MPNKSLDGIKKLSGEELARARKIVLDSIGETDKREKRKTFQPPNLVRDRQAIRPEPKPRDRGEEKNFSSPVRKMLDGISSGSVKPAGKKIVITKNEVLKGKENLAQDLGAEDKKEEKSKPVIFVPSRPVAFKRSLASGIARIEKAAREEAGTGKRLPTMNIQALRTGRNKKTKSWSLPGGPTRVLSDKLKSWSEDRKIKEEIKKERPEEREGEDIARKEAEAKARVEKEKEKIKIKEREEKIRRERKKRRKRARKIWFFETRKKLSGAFGGFGKGFRLAGKIIALATLFLVVSAILFYLIFALLLLKFNLDNKITRQIAGYIPVPAVVTKIGFIEYYDYQKTIEELKKELDNPSELDQAARALFIE